MWRQLFEVNKGFADSRAAALDSTFALPYGSLGGSLGGGVSGALAAGLEGGLEDSDPLAQMALAEIADRNLLRLVVCAAAATLVLALASSLV